MEPSATGFPDATGAANAPIDEFETLNPAAIIPLIATAEVMREIPTSPTLLRRTSFFVTQTPTVGSIRGDSTRHTQA
jgi:hypothetical protein